MTKQEETVTLPGTFKSMLQPSLTGDITVTLSGVSSLSDLLLTGDQTYKAVDAQIQLSYKSQEPPKTFKAQGRVAIANRTDQSMKQYEMIFTQADHTPGASFFAVTFSKTLVQNSAHEVPFENHSSEKGLMLSGHYSQLRNYDLGTVRIHLPAALIIQEGSPSAAPLQDSVQLTPAVAKEEYQNTAEEHLLQHLNRNRVKAGSFSHGVPPFQQQLQPWQQQSQPSYPYTPPMQYQEYERQHRQTISSPYTGDYARQQLGSPMMPHQHQPNTRHCYGCGDSGHLHKDCPRDQLFCYNCNQPGHSSKNCRRPKPWEQSQLQHPGMQQQQLNYHERSPSFSSQQQYQPLQPSYDEMHQQQSQQESSTWNLSTLNDQLPLTPQMYYKNANTSSSNSAAWSPVLNGNVQSSPLHSRANSFSSGSPRPNSSSVIKAAPGLSAFSSGTGGLFTSSSSSAGQNDGQGQQQQQSQYGKAVGSGSYSSVSSGRLSMLSKSMPKISELMSAEEEQEKELRIEDLITDDNDAEVWAMRGNQQ